MDAVNTRIKDTSRYEEMSFNVRKLADSLSWDKIASRHAKAYHKVGSLWGVYASEATASFSGVTGVPIDFMEGNKLQSSTGSEDEEKVSSSTSLEDEEITHLDKGGNFDLNNLPTPPHPDSPLWEPKDREKMIEHIDSMGDELDG